VHREPYLEDARSSWESAAQVLGRLSRFRQCGLSVALARSLPLSLQVALSV
jgi:hypothetical protein